MPSTDVFPQAGECHAGQAAYIVGWGRFIPAKPVAFSLRIATQSNVLSARWPMQRRVKFTFFHGPLLALSAMHDVETLVSKCAKRTEPASSPPAQLHGFRRARQWAGTHLLLREMQMGVLRHRQARRGPGRVRPLSVRRGSTSPAGDLRPRAVPSVGACARPQPHSARLKALRSRREPVARRDWPYALGVGLSHRVPRVQPMTLPRSAFESIASAEFTTYPEQPT